MRASMTALLHVPSERAVCDGQGVWQYMDGLTIVRRWAIPTLYGFTYTTTVYYSAGGCGCELDEEAEMIWLCPAHRAEYDRAALTWVKERR